MFNDNVAILKEKLLSNKYHICEWNYDENGYAVIQTFTEDKLMQFAAILWANKGNVYKKPYE